ncbi:MAG: TetR/AcrR family transcriptional regulator [Lachnospiraceae bacterium]|nr:TetR/AcrR family transcriptional regulator [Lachnospiraceae bacterium]
MDRRQMKTRAAIFDALSTLLKHKKFEDVTVQDIIDEANIGRSTFYSHFETKDSLLEEMCDEMFKHVFSNDLSPEKSHDFSKDEKDISSQLTHVLWHIKDHSGNIKAIMNGESEKMFTGYFKKYLEDAFKEHIRHMPYGVPEDFKEQFIIGSFVETVKWWIANGLKMNPEEVVGNFLKMVIRV